MLGGIANDMGKAITMDQNNAELFKTKMEVDKINKSLKQDGKQPVKELGKDEFLKLLITEVQHQDPSNPMQDREFIAQMAQFSSLEQMLNFNTGMKKLLESVSFQSSFSLLGHQVDIKSSDEADAEGNEKMISGTVDSVSRKGDDVFVKVNGEEYSAGSIIKVGN